MKKIVTLLLIGLSVASCTQTERGASFGAASGAVIGGLATGNVRGAAAGAIIGGAAGAVLGSVADRPGQCYYRDGAGREYIDACPQAYRPVVYRPRVVVRPAVVYRRPTVVYSPVVVRPRPRVVIAY